MLFLLFQLGEDRYAIDAARVAEVLPLLSVTRIPQALGGIAGVFNYRGTPVPVVDLSQLTMGRPAYRRLNTRIILVQLRGDNGHTRLLGLIAEKATQTVRRDPSDFTMPVIPSDRAPFLGPVATDAHGLLQWIDESKLLPAPIREVLFTQPADQS